MRRILSLLIIGLMAGSAYAGQPSDKYENMPARAYLVGNAHFDSQWRWTVQRSINEFIPNTLYQNFKLFEEFPEYIFNFEGGMKYQWIKEYYPREYELLKQYVAEGRWHLSGSSWDATDTNVPSVESAFRNILLAQTFYKNEFGRKSEDIMLPDCFGFSYVLPAVASHCDLIGFSTQKLSWRQNAFYPDGSKYPFQFGLWQGVDGSRIFAALDGGGYGWNPSEDLTQSKELTSRIGASAINAAYRYYGTRSSELRGDRGGSALPRTVRNIMRAKHKGGPFEIKISTSDDIFKDYAHLKDSDVLPVYDGELLMDVHATGCYTSQSDMKRLNRRNERLAYAAEASGVMADWLRVMPYQQYTLNDAWKRMIWHQFHDDLTGTSIPEAYTFSWNDEIISQKQFSSVIESSVAAVASQMNTSSVKGIPVIVYNALASKNNDIVTVDIDLPEGYDGVEVYSLGKKQRSQVLDIKGNTATVGFVSDSAPVSLSVYDLRPVKKASSLQSKRSGNQIENSVYKVRVDSKGDIVSIVDKRYGRELVAEGAYIGLAAFEENTSDRWPAWEILKQVLDKKPVAVTESVSVYIESDGPLMKVLNISKKLGNSSFVQRIILTEGAEDDRIDVETYAEWNSRRTLLKAQFPLAVASKDATYDLGLGTIARGNNTQTAYEVPAYQWADLSSESGDYGVTIMSDSKYGWDKPSDNCLRMTLLHTPTADYDWFPHQKTQDIGKHCFTYSIVGHKGVVEPHKASLKADVLNNRKYAFVTEKHKGSLGQSFSMIALSSDKVQLECLKLAEDGRDYIVRVYESSGNDLENVSIVFPSYISSASETNGIEEFVSTAEYKGNKLIFNIGRYSPKTFRVRLARSSESDHAAQKYKSLKLPVNTMAITSDAFCAVGNMDGLWNSYAAELIPDTLHYRGVPFVFAEDDYANAVRCSGQKISVPEGADGVYLLTASCDGERSASFVAGNLSVVAGVPYYSGFIGQCRYAGYYDAPYVRNGDIAYVGGHRHNPYVRNEPYVYTYMYMIYVPVEEGASEIQLTEDRNVTVFSATAVFDRYPELRSVSEMISRIM